MGGRMFRRLAAIAGIAASCLAAAPVAANSPYRMVPVPTNIIYTGEKLHAGMFVMRKFRASAVSDSVHMLDAASADGKVARAPLLPNRPVPISNMREPYLIDTAKPVRVRYRVAGIEIVTEGLPLEPGAIGDLVRVRSRNSSRVLSGIVQPDGTLEAVSQ